jgi:hypothetical protein
MKKNESTKIKVTENDFNFLKKVQGLNKSGEVLVRKSKTNDKEVNTVLVADDTFTYEVQATQLNPVFSGDKFGLKDIKSFLKTIATYGEMEEKDNEIVFGADKKKITYRKLDEATIQPVTLPNLDTAGYTPIQFNKEEIDEIKAGLKNEFSDYASFSLGSDSKLRLKVGEMTYDNLFELEVKDVERKELKGAEIKFLTKLNHLSRLFNSFDENSKVTMYLKAGQPLICIEKNELTHTKTFIASALPVDEENVDSIVDNA